MGKREKYCREILSRLDDFSRVEDLLIADCGLPGRRANLELASAFSDLARDGKLCAGWIPRLKLWAHLGVPEAPTNHPYEFLPFVAVQALAALPASTPDRLLCIEQVLRSAANDDRWRIREACALGMQRLGNQDAEQLLAILGDWMVSASHLDRRALLAGLSDPELLRIPSVLSFALESADAILRLIVELPLDELKTDNAKILLKALGFAPSVFVAAAPLEGFQMLGDWADIGSPVAARIVALNIRKARLAKRFQSDVEDIAYRLEARSC